MKRTSIIVCILLSIATTGFAQLNPMGSIYYLNPYLANPAMTGVQQGWELNGAYKSQWSAIDGAPNMQAITAGYGSEDGKTGLGLIFYNDKAGVVRTTTVKATYAYHMQLNSKATSIDFGLSAGILDEWANRAEIIGDQDDLAPVNFNDRKFYLDADFGIAFRNRALTVQATLPNLKRFLDRDLQRNVVDRSLFMASVSYKFKKDYQDFEIEPKLAFRAIENFKNLVDLGLNVGFSDNRLMLSGIYHSSGSITFGAGTNYKKQFTVLCQYTTNTKDLQSNGNGEAEIGIRYNFR